MLLLYLRLLLFLLLSLLLHLLYLHFFLSSVLDHNRFQIIYIFNWKLFFHSFFSKKVVVTFAITIEDILLGRVCRRSVFCSHPVDTCGIAVTIITVVFKNGDWVKLIRGLTGSHCLQVLSPQQAPPLCASPISSQLIISTLIMSLC